MSHQSLYRIYRPTTFSSLVGQKHIERTLRNAVATDSVAHAYLFSGPRGTGKTTTARILASALVCGHTKEGEPDGSCEQCVEISEGRHPDIIELDAASQTGVDSVREEIINNMHLATVHGKSKVYIIDEVHMLSKSAFNALLKTLEEPPPQVVFILCTTDPQKVLSTVRSRCQEFDFHPIAVSDMVDRLSYIAGKEDIGAEPAALEMIARHANGGMRDAITLFETMSAYSEGNIKVSDVEESIGGISGDSLASIMNILATRDTPACFVWVGQQVDAGADLVEVTRALLDYARDAYVLSALGAEAGGINRSGDDLKRLQEIAEKFLSPDQLERLLDLLFELTEKLRWSTEPRILLELTLARATRPQGDASITALAERVDVLERQQSGQVPVAASAAKAPAAESVENTPPAPPAPVVDTPSVSSSPVTEKTEEAPIASAPAASPASTVSNGMELSTDRSVLNRQWADVIEQIRQISPSREPIFANVRLQADVGEQLLTIEFSQAENFKYKQAKRNESKELLAEAIKNAFGREVSFVVEQATGDAAFEPAVAPVPTPPPELEPPPAPAHDYEPAPPADEPPPHYEPIPQASILEPTPPAEQPPRANSPLEVATLLDELGATKIRETTD